MCDGCWFGSSACVGAEKAYALAPVNGRANGMGMSGVAISIEDARVSVAYCADQMKNELNCSKRFIGVSKKNGQCWCAKASDNCENFVGFTNFIGYFFQTNEGNKQTVERERGEGFEGVIEVGLYRRLSTNAGMCMHAVIYAVI